MMKLALLAVAVGASIQNITDNLLFNASLPSFESHRDARDPSNLDWSSDGCTDAPDHPFDFPYLPACHRHDFGYQNYRAQSRFTKDAKDRIDDNFKKDLYGQCATIKEDNGGEKKKEACDQLADVYYAAVRAFGGRDAMRDEAYEHLHHRAAVAAYKRAVKAAQDMEALPLSS